jgi:hypothetical protein
MQDLQAKRERFLADAADCEMIGSLAGDPSKREIFRKLARDLRQMVADLDVTIAAKKERDAH